jgi:hypothetical protein
VIDYRTWLAQAGGLDQDFQDSKSPDPRINVEERQGWPRHLVIQYSLFPETAALPAIMNENEWQRHNPITRQGRNKCKHAGIDFGDSLEIGR